MGTWAGAIIETKGRADFAEIVSKHRTALTGPVTPWVLVEADVHLGSLGPPVFAQTLSRR